MCPCQCCGELEPDDFAFHYRCRIHHISVRKDTGRHKHVTSEGLSPWLPATAGSSSRSERTTLLASVVPRREVFVTGWTRGPVPVVMPAMARMPGSSGLPRAPVLKGWGIYGQFSGEYFASYVVHEVLRRRSQESDEICRLRSRTRIELWAIVGSAGPAYSDRNATTGSTWAARRAGR